VLTSCWSLLLDFAMEDERNLDTAPKVAADPAPRRDRLASLAEIRREMAKVYRQMRSGKVKTQDGTRLAYVLSMIGKLIESSDLQQRLETIEAKLARR
jgi:hypothetical protein